MRRIWENYLLPCSFCNSNQKRDRFPLDPAGQPLLIDPTREDPATHLVFSPTTGRYEPSPDSAKGGPSIEVFGLNRMLLARGRSNAWIALGQLLVRYVQYLRRGQTQVAEEIERTVREYPFAAVLAALLRIAEGPEAALFLEATTLQVIQERPEILTWR